MNDKKINLFGRKNMTMSEAAAATVTHGLPVAALIKEAAGSESLELLDMARELEGSGERVVAGDMSQLEGALVRQFVALDTLFGELGSRGMRSRDLRTKETLIKLALRAQSQARATAETLGVLKNPPLVIARQANISTGPQQINNTVTTTPPRVANIKNTPTELLDEAQHVNNMDAGAQGKTSVGNSEMETVGIEYRTENRKREKPLQDEYLERRTARKAARVGTGRQRPDART